MTLHSDFCMILVGFTFCESLISLTLLTFFALGQPINISIQMSILDMFPYQSIHMVSISVNKESLTDFRLSFFSLIDGILSHKLEAGQARRRWGVEMANF